MHTGTVLVGMKVVKCMYLDLDPNLHLYHTVI